MAIGKGIIKYGNTDNLATSSQFPALDACRLVVDGSSVPVTTHDQANDITDAGKAWRQKYLFRRDELTNSPIVTYPELSAPANIANVANYSSRDVDGTFMGEWGYVRNYAGSGWELHLNYWTAEMWSTVSQFYVGTDGGVGFTAPDNNVFIAVCRD